MRWRESHPATKPLFVLACITSGVIHQCGALTSLTPHIHQRARTPILTTVSHRWANAGPLAAEGPTDGGDGPLLQPVSFAMPVDIDKPALGPGPTTGMNSAPAMATTATNDEHTLTQKPPRSQGVASGLDSARERVVGDLAQLRTDLRDLAMEEGGHAQRYTAAKVDSVSGSVARDITERLEGLKADTISRGEEASSRLNDAKAELARRSRGASRDMVSTVRFPSTPRAISTSILRRAMTCRY